MLIIDNGKNNNKLGTENFFPTLRFTLFARFYNMAHFSCNGYCSTNYTYYILQSIISLCKHPTMHKTVKYFFKTFTTMRKKFVENNSSINDCISRYVM
jgi:hypothetical protein